MIVFKTLEIQNFLSYGNYKTKIILNTDTPTLITGINYDSSVNGEFDSNGSGKSSILNAISFACYNKAVSIDSTKKDTLINNINKKDMLVKCTLKVGKKTYTISRYRKNKAMGGDGVKIEVGTGKNIKDITPDSVANADKFIYENIIGIPFEIFNKIVAYAAGEEAFLKQPLAKQREVMEELFSYTELSKKADVLKELIKGHKRDLEYAKESNQSILEEAARHTEQLNGMVVKRDEWDESTAEKRASIKKEIRELKKIDFDGELEKLNSIGELVSLIKESKSEIKILESTIKQLKDEQEKYESYDDKKVQKLSTLEKSLEQLTTVKVDPAKEEKLFSSIEGFIEKISEVEGLLRDNSHTLKKLTAKRDELDKELSHLDDDRCPYCLQKYADAQKKVKELESGRDDVNKEISSLEEDVLELNTTLEATEAKREKAKNKLVFSNERELSKHLSEMERLATEIDRIKNEENPYSDNTDAIINNTKLCKKYYDEISAYMEEVDTKSEKLLFTSERELYERKAYYDSLLKSLDDDSSNPYVEIIERLSKYEPKKDKNDEIDALIENINHEEFLLKLLTKKDSFIRKALMDKYLPFLNERLRYYLSLVALPHKVVFTPDLSTSISQFDQEVPYAALSAGQKARVNIALSLSFRDVLQSKHNFINLFILDECLDVGLSNVGVKKTVTAIKEVAKVNKLSMFVISHRDEVKNSFPEVLSIEMRNGFSKVA